MNNPFEGPKLFSPSFVDALRAYAPELLEVKATGAGAVPEVRRFCSAPPLSLAMLPPWTSVEAIVPRPGHGRRSRDAIGGQGFQLWRLRIRSSAVGLASRTAAVWAAVPRVGSSMGTRWRVSRPMSKMIASQPAAAIWGA